MNRDDVMRETFHHVRRVGMLMLDVIGQLQKRAMEHDDSKFGLFEFDSFANSTPKLKNLTYGSEEYKEALKELGTALGHHYENNRHHPEFHPNGINDMNLLDLIEMLSDWKAATERHTDGNLATSIVKNATRFEYDEHIMFLLARTAIDMKWITQESFSEALAARDG